MGGSTMTRKAKAVVALLLAVALWAGGFVSEATATPGSVHPPGKLCNPNVCSEEVAAACPGLRANAFNRCRKDLIANCRSGVCSCTGDPSLPACGVTTTTSPTTSTSSTTTATSSTTSTTSPTTSTTRATTSTTTPTTSTTSPTTSTTSPTTSTTSPTTSTTSPTTSTSSTTTATSSTTSTTSPTTSTSSTTTATSSTTTTT